MRLCIGINAIVVQMTDSVELLNVATESKPNFNQYAQMHCSFMSFISKLSLAIFLEFLFLRKIFSVHDYDSL